MSESVIPRASMPAPTRTLAQIPSDWIVFMEYRQCDTARWALVHCLRSWWSGKLAMVFSVMAWRCSNFRKKHSKYTASVGKRWRNWAQVKQRLVESRLLSTDKPDDPTSPQHRVFGQIATIL